MNLKLKAILPATLLLSIALIAPTSQAFNDEKLAKIIAGDHRTPEYAVRDKSRHPQQTLEFFGIRDNMTLVEITPGGGWYTEILSPYLRDHGTYIAAGYDPKSDNEYYAKNAKAFADKLAANPAIYDKTVLSVMQAPDKLDFAPAGSVDMVVSFRNTHNWHSRGQSDEVYGAIFKALKPGGIFGVVQHRAGEKNPADTSGKMGYLKQADVIELAEKAGFKLVATSEINANPKDPKNYAKGVWTLPPVLRMGEENKHEYLAIGESDRMTLKFVKP